MKLPVQLVKVGKHTFCWSAVGGTGEIMIPPEAITEYGLVEGEKLIVMPGSRKSGGFALKAQTLAKLGVASGDRLLDLP
jgi:hypothetical protein